MKAKELRNSTPDELAAKLADCRKELFNLRMQQATAQIEMPSRIRELRRDAARIETLLTEAKRKAT